MLGGVGLLLSASWPG